MIQLGDVRMNHMDKNYELQVGLYQMMVLLLFNKATSLSIAEITEGSGLPLADVKRSLKVKTAYEKPPNDMTITTDPLLFRFIASR